MPETLVQDIEAEPLLKHAKRETVGSQKLPVVAGVALSAKVGEGVTGAVFRGQNKTLNREVAVKVLPYTDDTSERFLRFIAHAKSAKNVKSPHCVEVFDAGDEAGICYQVTEYFPSLSAEKHLSALKERLKPGMSETAMLDMAVGVCDGLSAAHKAGLLHLDLRPSSILIPLPNANAVQAPGAVGTLEFGEAKLSDLGLAFNEFVQRLLDGTPAETGMPGFMSPEQARGDKNIGKTSDVFSMGATLYTLLVGQPPFGGLSVEAVLNATLEQSIIEVRTWRPDISRATAKIIEICLRKDPQQRFGDAGVLMQALQISRGAMDGTLDIQQIAIKEIEGLVKPSGLNEQPNEQTLLLSPAAAAELAQSSAALPALTKSQTLPKPKSEPALEPTMMATPTAKPEGEGSAADMFSDLLKKKVAEDQPGKPKSVAMATVQAPAVVPAPKKTITQIFKPDVKPPVPDEERTMMLAPGAMGGAPSPGSSAARLAAASASATNHPALAAKSADSESPGTAIIPPTAAVNAAADNEWVDPYVSQEQPKRGSMGLLVAALFLVACGAGAWKMGYLGGAEKKPTRLAMNPPPFAQPPEQLVKDQEEKAKAEAEKKAKAEADAKAEAEAKAKADADAAEAKAKAEAAKVEAELKAKAEAEKTAADAALKAKQEEEAKKAAEAAKKEEELKTAEARAKAEADAKAKADAEAKAKADEEKRIAEAKAKDDEAKALAEAKAKAESEAKAKDEETKRLAEAKARADALEKARLDAEAKTKAEETAKLKAQQEEEAKRAETKAKQEAELKAIAEAKANAEAKAKAAAELKAKQDAEAKAAELKAKQDAEAKAIAEAKKREGEKTTEASAIKPPVSDLKKEISISLGDGVRIDFVLVPGGSFSMGTDAAKLHEMSKKYGFDEKDYIDEIPAHSVELKPYYIAKTPLTVAQFRRFVSATGYLTSAEKVGAGYILKNRQWQFTPGASWQKPGFGQKDDHPVVMLSWRDCEAFSAWASREAGKRLRLPTESEWEYAARGPQNSLYPWGDEWSPKLANHADKKLEPFCLQDWTYSRYDDGFAFTSPVGRYPNGSWCGALDMAGNVFQWCSDIYDRYPEKGGPPQLLMDENDVPHDAKRVLRGGSYLFLPLGCRSAARRAASQKSASVEFGCRIVMAAE